MGHSVKQGTGNVDIINKINPSETYSLILPLLVGPVVDNASNTSHHLAILISQEVFGLAEFEGSILILAQRVLFITIKVGRIILIALVQVVVQLDESIQLSLVGDSSDFNCCHRSFWFYLAKVTKKHEIPKQFNLFYGK